MPFTYLPIGSYSEAMSETDVTVGTVYETVRVFQLAGLVPHGTLKIDNTGGTAFSGLKLQKQIAQGDGWMDWIEGADWLSLAGAASQSVTELSVDFSAELAGGESQTAQIYTGAVHAIRIQAKVSSGSTTANVSGTFSGIG